jgi:hypothetical protein
VKAMLLDSVIGLALVLWWMALAWVVSFWTDWPVDRVFMMMLAGVVAVDYAKQKRLKKFQL